MKILQLPNVMCVQPLEYLIFDSLINHNSGGKNKMKNSPDGQSSWNKLLSILIKLFHMVLLEQRYVEKFSIFSLASRESS